MKITKIFACDFETTVYENQEYTEVWSSACIELKKNAKPYIFHSLKEQFDFFKSLKCDIIAYYHNLKFDGSFWINYLLNNDYKNAYEFNELDVQDTTKLSFKDMPNRSFNYTISSFGQWYQVIIKENGYKIELRDSLKLFPFSSVFGPLDVSVLVLAFASAHVAPPFGFAFLYNCSLIS